MNIAFRVDASAQIGTGHLVRCLTLANALQSLGARATFVCRHITPFLTTKLAEAGHKLVTLPAAPAAAGSGDYAAWLGTSQSQDLADTTTALKGDDWDWLVVDHYALDAEWEKAVRPLCRTLMVVDDLANRSHDCDVLLDQNLTLSIDRYKYLVPASCRRFEGPAYALLRPEFRQARDKPARDPANHRLNIFFGGTDPYGATVKALNAIAAIPNRGFAVDVIAGTDNSRREEISRRSEGLAGSVLYVQPSSMAALFSRATLALGAGGTTSWERCCVGLPAVIISVAQNQRGGSAALARARAAINLGPLEELCPVKLSDLMLRLLNRPRLLAAMGRRASSLVDGRGTERIAIFLMQNNITLSLAVMEDAELTWAWRNHPLTRKFFHDPAPIAWNHHQDWWQRSLDLPARSLLIARCGAQKIGVMRFDYHDREALVSIYLDPALTGMGVGKTVLMAGSRWLRHHRPDIIRERAEILPENLRSRRSFELAGYHQIDGKNWVRSVGDA
jgi:UDP-2,4-diacetamido-2,4,6-trideoxy-beta-L-altropyranose hydrolase